MLKWLMVPVAMVYLCPNVTASHGDRVNEFGNCVTTCKRTTCYDNEKFCFISFLTDCPCTIGWSCTDECKYDCMWAVVELFQHSNQSVPQFYGKWPFIRVLGLQEPASVIFSLANLFSFTYFLVSLVRSVSPSCPMYNVWILYSVVCIFAWMFSTIYHAKDTVLTEMLDYFCAFASVSLAFYTSLLRLSATPFVSATRVVLFGTPLLGYLIYHCWYLAFVRFDYGYNMKANVVIASLNAVNWISWSSYVYYKQGPSYKRVRYSAAVIILTMCFLCLELFDFEPIFWTFDAHSLWHMCTIPLPILWAKFAVEDCKLLYSVVEADKKAKSV